MNPERMFTKWSPKQTESLPGKQDITMIVVKSSRMLGQHGFLAHVFQLFHKYQAGRVPGFISGPSWLVSWKPNGFLHQVIDPLVPSAFSPPDTIWNKMEFQSRLLHHLWSLLLCWVPAFSLSSKQQVNFASRKARPSCKFAIELLTRASLVFKRCCHFAMID